MSKGMQVMVHESRHAGGEVKYLLDFRASQYSTAAMVGTIRMIAL